MKVIDSLNRIENIKLLGTIANDIDSVPQKTHGEVCSVPLD